MTLSASNTGNDIVTAIEGELSVTLDASTKALWSAIVGALYTRIKADIAISSQVASGIAVATTGGPSAQTGATTATGTAASTSVT